MDKEKFTFYPEYISQAIEEYFSADRLVQMAIDLTEETYEEEAIRPNREELMPLVKRVTTQEGFNPLIRLTAEMDVTVATPEGVKEILHGSTYWFSAFRILEDPKLNQALDKYLEEYQPNDIPRYTFTSGLMDAALLMGMIVLPHDLERDDIEKIIKYHCLRGLLRNPRSGLSRQGAGLLLYGCLKVVENKFLTLGGYKRVEE